MEFTYNIKENKKTNKDIDNNLSRCFRPFGSRVMVLSIKCDSLALQTWVTWRMRNYCGRQEEPAILISRLLLRMRRMYVACKSHTKNKWNALNAILSRAFGPSITCNRLGVFCTSVTWNLCKPQPWSKSGLTFDRRRAHLRNLWLLLVSSVSNCMQEPITRSEQLPY